MDRPRPEKVVISPDEQMDTLPIVGSQVIEEYLGGIFVGLASPTSACITISITD